MHQRGSYLHSELVLGIFLVIKEDFEWQLFARHVGNSLWKPVESAGDAAARLARVNEELGAMLYGGMVVLMWGGVVLAWVDVARLMREETLRTKKVWTPVDTQRHNCVV